MKADPTPILGVALAFTLVAAPARADPVDACLRAADEAQVLRDRGKLQRARESLLTCSRSACPRLVRADCAGWLADVDARLPSVVLAAQDPQGRDAASVKVTVDGVALDEGISGRSLPLDPGAHRFVFERAGAPALEQAVVLREGERRRLVSVRFPAPDGGAAPAPPPPGRGALAAAITLGGVTLAGGGVFAGLALGAKRDFDHLRTTCAPRCPPALVAPVRTKEIAADVALGVGVGAAVAAVVILVLRPREGTPAGAWLRVVPTPGGGLGLGVGRRF